LRRSRPCCDDEPLAPLGDAYVLRTCEIGGVNEQPKRIPLAVVLDVVWKRVRGEGTDSPDQPGVELA
jgi:hypothetical protein